MELAPDIYDRIEALSEAGNDHLEHERYTQAIGCWQQALDLVPAPQSDWEAAAWLFASIGDAQFEQGQWELAKQSFFDALNCPGGMENPFVEYRLGQVLLKQSQPDRAVQHLLQAYMLDGEDIFLADDDEGKAALSLLRARGLL